MVNESSLQVIWGGRVFFQFNKSHFELWGKLLGWLSKVDTCFGKYDSFTVVNDGTGRSSHYNQSADVLWTLAVFGGSLVTLGVE